MNFFLLREAGDSGNSMTYYAVMNILKHFKIFSTFWHGD